MITGRVQPELLYTISELRCHMHTSHQVALVHSRAPELIHPFETGTAFLSLLEGEGCLYLPVCRTTRQAVQTDAATAPNANGEFSLVTSN